MEKFTKLNTRLFKIINLVAMALMLPFAFFSYGTIFTLFTKRLNASGWEVFWYKSPSLVIFMLFFVASSLFMLIKKTGKEKTVATFSTLGYLCAMILILISSIEYLEYFDITFMLIIYTLLAIAGFVLNGYLILGDLKEADKRKILFEDIKGDCKVVVDFVSSKINASTKKEVKSVEETTEEIIEE